MAGGARVSLLAAVLLVACSSASGDSGALQDPQPQNPAAPPAVVQAVPPTAYGLPHDRGEQLDPDMTLKIRCVRAPCGDVPPVSAANRVYALYHAFPDFYLFPEPAAELLTPALKALIDADVACATREGMCAIGADPWSAAQDGERQPPVMFVTSGVERRTLGVPVAARVAVCFNFVLEGHAPRQRCAQVNVTRQRGEPWRVDDLIDPEGQSLRATLQDTSRDASLP